MPAGRPSEGPKHARKLDASRRAQQRLEVILETLSGDKSVSEASEELGINEARFHVIRKQALQAAAERLEPQRTGRPPRQIDPAAEEIAELKAELARKEADLRVAEVRAELAVAGVLDPAQVPSARKKKPRSTGVRARLRLPRRGGKRRKP